MDIEHPDITSAHRTGYDRATWRAMNEEENEQDCDRDAADYWED